MHRSDFTVGGQRIPIKMVVGTVLEEPVTSLGRVLDELLRDKNQEAVTVKERPRDDDIVILLY